jgi:TP901 family phage tail tape measure protein
MAELATLELVIRTQRAKRNLKSTQTELKKTGTQAKKTEATFKKTMAGMGAATQKARGGVMRLQGALALLGVGLGLGAVIGTLKNFEFAMSRVRAITGATGLTMKALTDTARDLGGTTVFTATQAAEGMRLLSLAGFEANEAIAAIPGTLNLAVAGAVDLSTAADITASAIRGFNLEADEAARVADVLAKVTTSANTTIEELGNAVKFVAPVAAATGQSIESVAAAIGVLSDAGLKGTLAGTGLRRVLVGLVNVTPKGEKALKNMGLAVEDMNPEVKEITEIFATFRDRAFGTAEAFELFGLRGGPAALVLTQMADRLEELTGSAEDAAGSAQAMADIMRDNLRGDLLLLRSAIEEVILQQSGFRDALRDTVQEATLVAQALGGNIDPLPENIDKYDEAAEGLRDFGRVMVDVFKLTKFLTSGVGTLASDFANLSDAVSGVGDVFEGTKGAGEAVGDLVQAVGSFGVGGPIARAFEEGSDIVDRELSEIQGAILETQKIVDQFEPLRGDDLVEALPAAERQVKQLAREMQAIALRMGKLKEELSALGQETGVSDVIGDLLLSPGWETTGERAKEINLQLKIMQAALEAAGVEMGKLADEGNRARGVRDGLKEVADVTRDLVKAGTDVENTLKRALESAKDAADKTLSKLEFKIEQARLGAGAEADLLRDVGEALEAADLRVIITPEIADVREKLEKQMKDVTEALQGPLEDAQREVLTAQLEAAKEGIRRLDDLAEGRQKVRVEIEAEARALHQLTLEQERGEELLEMKEKLLEDLRTPTEELIQLEKDLNEMKAEGLITAEAAATILERAARETPFGKVMEGLRKELTALGIVTEKDAMLFRALSAAQKDNATVTDEQKREIKELVDEIDRMNRVNAQAKMAIEAVKTPLEIYEKNLTALASALDQNLISGAAFEAQAGNLRLELERGRDAAREHAVELEKLGKSGFHQGLIDLREEIGLTDDALAGLTKEGVRDFSSAITEAFREGELNGEKFLDILARIGDRLIELAMQEFLLKPLLEGATGPTTTVEQQGANWWDVAFKAVGVAAGAASSFGGGSVGEPSGGAASIAGQGAGAPIEVEWSFAHGGVVGRGARKSITVPAGLFADAPRFQFGGTTGDNIPALLSRNEAVVPLRGGRAIPVDMGEEGRRTNVVNFNISTPDAESFGRSRSQLAAQMSTALRRAQTRNG